MADLAADEAFARRLQEEELLAAYTTADAERPSTHSLAAAYAQGNHLEREAALARAVRAESERHLRSTAAAAAAARARADEHARHARSGGGGGVEGMYNVAVAAPPLPLPAPPMLPPPPYPYHPPAHDPYMGHLGDHRSDAEIREAHRRMEAATRDPPPHRYTGYPGPPWVPGPGAPDRPWERHWEDGVPGDVPPSGLYDPYPPRPYAVRQHLGNRPPRLHINEEGEEEDGEGTRLRWSYSSTSDPSAVRSGGISFGAGGGGAGGGTGGGGHNSRAAAAAVAAAAQHRRAHERAHREAVARDIGVELEPGWDGPPLPRAPLPRLPPAPAARTVGGPAPATRGSSPSAASIAAAIAARRASRRGAAGREPPPVPRHPSGEPPPVPGHPDWDGLGGGAADDAMPARLRGLLATVLHPQNGLGEPDELADFFGDFFMTGPRRRGAGDAGGGGGLFLDGAAAELGALLAGERVGLGRPGGGLGTFEGLSDLADRLGGGGGGASEAQIAQLPTRVVGAPSAAPAAAARTSSSAAAAAAAAPAADVPVSSAIRSAARSFRSGSRRSSRREEVAAAPAAAAPRPAGSAAVAGHPADASGSSAARGSSGHAEGSTAETCTVCLSEYGDGDELRTLPCMHSFHSECIDPWLRSKSSCPVCLHRLDGTPGQ